MITKCLNRITTETEISASHACHFLLGYSDAKTSHKFTRINLHTLLAWCTGETKKYDANLNDAIPLTEADNDVDNDDDHIDTNNQDEDDDNDDDDDGDDNTNMYSISTGNAGLVVVNQMTDYINRGEELSDMCFYEYSEKVYKVKIQAGDIEKNNKLLKEIADEKANKKKFNFSKKRKRDKRSRPKYFFSSEHPQSQTHWQNVRRDEQKLVPALSTLPPNKNTNELKYQKCMLLLFKPFRVFTDLFNGISWTESYETANFVSPYTEYIENIQEMHIGIQEREDNRDDEDNSNDDDVIDESDELDPDQPIDVIEKDLHDQTTSALDIIKSTGWLEESVSNHQTIQPISENGRPLRLNKQWEKEIEKQNEDRLNNEEQNECETDQRLPTPSESVPIADNCDVEFTIEPRDDKNLDQIACDVINEYSLNKKQKVAFELAISNVIKRERKEETQQIIGYVGGPGGTGKSQVINAIVEFHKRVKAKHKLKLTAYTGTAAKHINGSTTSALFSLSSKSKKKLERRFQHVNTIIVDEVSMIGCSQLHNISKQLTKAKHAVASDPFGGVDIIFFGDFIQFPPIMDSPLYSGWKNESIRSTNLQAEVKKQLGINLWRQVNQVVLLDEQMRIKDKAYQDILNRLREGKCTDSDITILNKRVIGNFSGKISSISGNRLISPGNELVMNINKMFASHHSQDKKVFVTTAKDSVKKKELPTDLANKIKDYPATWTKGLPRELPMYVGMPVFLTQNIAVELGLTNGTTGIIKSIHLRNGEMIEEDTGFHHVEFKDTDFIVVELDDITVKPLRGLDPNHIPIFPMKKNFSVSVKGRKNKFSVNRCHFPIVPRFACTAHKSQGMTLDKAIVDLVPQPNLKSPIDINFAYVPLSRVRRLEDLVILRPSDANVIKVKPNPACLAMMEHFKTMDKCKDM